MRPGRLITATAAAGVAGLAWAIAETHRFTLRHAVAPVLPPGAAPARILHLSDLHMVPRQADKQRWVRDLARLQPDVVVVTGDFLADRYAVPVVLETLAPLTQFPGMFVLGSNDYYAPTSINPIKYLSGPSGLAVGRPPLPWGDLVAGLVASGWVDLTNTNSAMSLAGLTVAVRGVDDPHIMRDRYEEVAGPFGDVDLTMAVVHAPYLRILNALARDAADLVIAGHTHGGQLCLPGGRALVTNCDLPRSMARGLHRYQPRPARVPRTDDEGRDPWIGPQPDSAQTAPWLHVSAGLGTSPFAPVRFACRPEATVLTLVGGPEPTSDRGARPRVE